MARTLPTGRGDAHTVRGASPRARPVLPAALTNWRLAGCGATSALHRRGGSWRGGRGSNSGGDARSRHRKDGHKAPAAAAAASPAVPPLGDSNGPERAAVTAPGNQRPAAPGGPRERHNGRPEPRRPRARGCSSWRLNGGRNDWVVKSVFLALPLRWVLPV